MYYKPYILYLRIIEYVKINFQLYNLDWRLYSVHGTIYFKLYDVQKNTLNCTMLYTVICSTVKGAQAKDNFVDLGTKGPKRV